MKQSGGQQKGQHTQFASNKRRPEIRDNLDHREGEEQQTKGDDVTHNTKETKKEHLKEKKEKDS